MDDINDGSNRAHDEMNEPDFAKPRKEELLPEEQEFKEMVLQKLINLRDKGVQPQLYDKDRPERTPHIQRANFIYALIFKVKEEYRAPNDLLEFVHHLEGKYPLATSTVDEVKEMLHSLPSQS